MSEPITNPEPATAGQEGAPASKADLKALLEQVAKLLVDKPDEVLVDLEHDRGEDVYWLEVAPEDIGKVIGKQGRTVRSLRTLIEAAGSKQGRRATLEIVEEDEDDGPDGDGDHGGDNAEGNEA